MGKMACECLKIYDRPNLAAPRMVVGLTGWMDGGEVSTGTVDGMVKRLGARSFAEIDADGFYIYSFPGPMEVSALFRPFVDLQDGLVAEFREPRNVFYADEVHQMIFFVGKEPHLKWRQYTKCVFEVVEQFGVQEIYFAGSYAGLTPHSREPKLTSSVSQASLKEKLAEYHFKFSNYEGPASITNHMLQVAQQRGVKMMNLVAEIPAYVQGRNPKCIESMTRHLAGLLHLELDLEDMRLVSDEFERRLNEVIEERDDLAEHITKLEENYDKEVFDNEMGDLKDWLQERGIRLD
jgi:proteasome assembly chaperone (PAC2) family protein